jgi:hypothetical protein
MHFEEWLLAVAAAVGVPLCWWLQTAGGKDFERRFIERLRFVAKREATAPGARRTQV